MPRRRMKDMTPDELKVAAMEHRKRIAQSKQAVARSRSLLEGTKVLKEMHSTRNKRKTDSLPSKPAASGE